MEDDERLTREERLGLLLLAAPAALGALADLLLWRVAGPVEGVPRGGWWILSWPTTAPAAARELIRLGSLPLSAISGYCGWQWRDSGIDWMAWISSILFWLILPLGVTRIGGRLLKFCIRIGITKLVGAILLTFTSAGRFAIPVLWFQWALLAVAVMVMSAVRLTRRE